MKKLVTTVLFILASCGPMDAISPTPDLREEETVPCIPFTKLADGQWQDTPGPHQSEPIDMQNFSEAILYNKKPCGPILLLWSPDGQPPFLSVQNGVSINLEGGGRFPVQGKGLILYQSSGCLPGMGATSYYEVAGVSKCN